MLRHKKPPQGATGRSLYPERHQTVDHEPAGEAEVYSVIAYDRSGGGAQEERAPIVVEKGTPGFTFGKTSIKWAIRASATRETGIHEDCRVPRRISRREGNGLIVRW